MSKYLKYLKKEDIDIYNEEFYDFLPGKIIDSHVHAWKNLFYISEPSESRQKIVPFYDPEIISGFDFDDFKFVTETLFPGKKYEGIFFGLPFKEVNLQKNNGYVAGIYKKYCNHGLYMPEPDMKIIPGDFFENGFIGFKPYPDLADLQQHEDISKLDIDIRMFDFISKEVFDFANEYSLIVLIHIPRKGRLNDRRNIEELKQIGRMYPKIKLVLAHAGRSYCFSDIKNTIDFLKGGKNLYVDTAMINSSAVIKLLLEELGPEKVLYGSDLAVSAIKGKNVDINNHHYFVTNTPRDWSLSSTNMKLDDFTYCIYEIIRSVRTACISLNLSKADIKNIFFDNINNLIFNINDSIKK